jgi:hypothetical protein
MDKAFIFDVFDFVSFHICKGLLDKGIEVRGMRVEEKGLEFFLDEKRLEIGRNANFVELNFFDNQNENGALILSFYDLFMLHKDHLFQKETIIERLSKLIKEKKEKKEKIVFLLPIQMLTKTFYFPGVSEIRYLINQVEDTPNNAQYIYLPTIYGPWQPATFLFQHTILSSLQNDLEFKDLREDTNDALFIDDAMTSILSILEGGQPGKYAIETGEKGQWERCAAYLNVQSKISVVRERGQEISDVTFVKPKKLTTISDSMSLQKEHIKKLLESYK